MVRNTGTNVLSIAELEVYGTISSIVDTNEPLIIEAESYDATGGTFDDSSAGGPGSGVQISGDGAHINYVNSGDWIEYIVNIPEIGDYEIEYLIASTRNNAIIDFNVDGTFINTTNVPNTGGNVNFQELNASSTVTFTRTGNHVIRLEARQATWAWRLDSFKLTRVIGGVSLKISSDALVEKPVNIYPNPVQNQLNFKNVEKYHTINIYNMVGQKVLSKKLELDYLNLSNVIDGIYILELVGDRSKQIKKIVVKH